MGEVLPRYENHVRIDKDVMDAWGIPVLTSMQDTRQRIQHGEGRGRNDGRAFHNAGFEIVCRNDKMYPPGYSIHELGTCRMGDNPKTSVLNKWNQSHDIKNLFVVDGSSFVTAGWQNPTMTILRVIDAGLGISRRPDAQSAVYDRLARLAILIDALTVEINLESDFSQHRLNFGISHELLPDQAGPIVLDHHNDRGLIQSHIDRRNPVLARVEGIARSIDIP